MLAELLAYNKSALCLSASPAFSFVSFYTLSDVWLQHLSDLARETSQLNYVLLGPLLSNSFASYLGYHALDISKSNAVRQVAQVVPGTSFFTLLRFVFCFLFFSALKTSKKRQPRLVSPSAAKNQHHMITQTILKSSSGICLEWGLQTSLWTRTAIKCK